MTSNLARLPILVALILPSLLPVSGYTGVFDKIFAPKADIWSRWSAHDESNDRRIDHGAWDRFLSAYARESPDGVVRVGYGEVKKTDRNALTAYITSLAETSISTYSRAEQFAYWVNLYNAQTVSTVLEHYPVKSIRDIDTSPGLFADGPWRKKAFTIENEAVSLDDIEHRILRPIWMEPRVHYALNCASIGCPNLPPVAFTASNTDKLLTEGARTYINHPRAVDITDQTLTLSSIYSWFEIDFDREGGVLAHLRRYATPELAAALEAFDRPSDFRYDWMLNDLATSAVR